MTDEDGQTPDGVYYRTVALTDAQGRQRVIEPAVLGQGFSPGNAFDAGPSVDAIKYQGWLKDSPHRVRVMQNAREYEVALPINEAKSANPGIEE